MSMSKLYYFSGFLFATIQVVSLTAMIYFAQVVSLAAMIYIALFLHSTFLLYQKFIFSLSQCLHLLQVRLTFFNPC